MAGLAGFLTQVEALLRVAHPRIQFGGIGYKRLDEHGAWPRLVWLIAGAQHGAAEKSKPDGANTAPQILTRRVALEAHVWGKDLEMTEALIDDVIAALYRVAEGSINWNGEEWPEDEIVNDGLVAAVKFSVNARVTRRRFVQTDPTADSQFTTADVTTLDVDTTNAP